LPDRKGIGICRNLSQINWKRKAAGKKKHGGRDKHKAVSATEGAMRDRSNHRGREFEGKARGAG